MPPDIAIPALGPTGRLVELPARELRDTVTGGRPRLSTRLRLAHRGGALLVRFDCRHAGITATMRSDNDPLWKEDVVEAFLAFEDPPRSYLELEVNPLGARFSARVESPDLSRDGMTVETVDLPEFRADVKVFERCWSALLKIPLGAGGALGVLPSDTPRKSSAATGLRVPEGPRPTSPLALEPCLPPLHLERGSGGEVFLANFFRIDRASASFQALFPTLADPPDFHRPERFGRFRISEA